MGLNAGFLALCVNFIVTFIVSSVTPVQPDGFETAGSCPP
jgi:hypothetical protein